MSTAFRQFIFLICSCGDCQAVRLPEATPSTLHQHSGAEEAGGAAVRLGDLQLLQADVQSCALLPAEA